MPITDTTPLTAVTALRPWHATAFDVYQGRTDYVDFRFTLGDGTTRTVLRLKANNDVSLYGEVILENGALRSTSSFQMTSYSKDEPLVSFRAGPAVGVEMLSIQLDGTICGPDSVVKVSNPAGGDRDVLQIIGVATFASVSGNSIMRTDSVFNIQDGSEKDRFHFGLGGTESELHLLDESGDIGMYITVQNEDYSFIRVGGVRVDGPSRRGVVFINNDSTEEAERAGYLVLYAKDGTPYYLWVSADGKLRIYNTIPSTDTIGTVVGTQTA